MWAILRRDGVIDQRVRDDASVPFSTLYFILHGYLSLFCISARPLPCRLCVCGCWWHRDAPTPLRRDFALSGSSVETTRDKQVREAAAGGGSQESTEVSVADASCDATRWIFDVSDAPRSHRVILSPVSFGAHHIDRFSCTGCKTYYGFFFLFCVCVCVGALLVRVL